MSAGHLRPRGKNSWELKFESGPRDPASGKRKIQYVSFRGHQARGAGRARPADRGRRRRHLCRAQQAHRGGACQSPDRPLGGSEAISARTAQRYRQLLDGQIRPHIGARLVQKLSTVDVETVARHA